MAFGELWIGFLMIRVFGFKDQVIIETLLCTTAIFHMVVSACNSVLRLLLEFGKMG